MNFIRIVSWTHAENASLHVTFDIMYAKILHLAHCRCHLTGSINYLQLLCNSSCDNKKSTCIWKCMMRRSNVLKTIGICRVCQQVEQNFHIIRLDESRVVGFFAATARFILLPWKKYNAKIDDSWFCAKLAAHTLKYEMLDK